MPTAAEGKNLTFSLGRIVEVMLCHGHFLVVHKHPSSPVCESGLHSLVNVADLFKLSASCYSWDYLKEVVYCRSSVSKIILYPRQWLIYCSGSNSIYM